MGLISPFFISRSIFYFPFLFLLLLSSSDLALVILVFAAAIDWYFFKKSWFFLILFFGGCFGWYLESLKIYTSVVYFSVVFWLDLGIVGTFLKVYFLGFFLLFCGLFCVFKCLICYWLGYFFVVSLIHQRGWKYIYPFQVLIQQHGTPTPLTQ